MKGNKLMSILLKNLGILLTTAIIGSTTTVGYSSNQNYNNSKYTINSNNESNNNIHNNDVIIHNIEINQVVDYSQYMQHYMFTVQQQLSKMNDDELDTVQVSEYNANQLLCELYIRIPNARNNNRIDVTKQNIIELIEHSSLDLSYINFIKEKFYYLIKQNARVKKHNDIYHDRNGKCNCLSRYFNSKKFENIVLGGYKKSKQYTINTMLDNIDDKNIRDERYCPKEFQNIIKQNKQIFRRNINNWLEHYNETNTYNITENNYYDYKKNIKDNMKKIVNNTEDYKIENNRTEHILLDSNHIFSDVGTFEKKEYKTIDNIDNQKHYKLIHEIIKQNSQYDKSSGMYKLMDNKIVNQMILEVVQHYLLKPMMKELINSENINNLNIKVPHFNSKRIIVSDSKNDIVLHINDTKGEIVTFYNHNTLQLDKLTNNN